jgi:hypothetical protein
MKVTEVKFTRRYNTGEYEFEEYTASAIVEDSELASTVLQALKLEIAKTFSGEVEAAPAVPKKEEKKKDGKPKSDSRVSKRSKDVEELEEETAEQSSDSTEDEEEAEDYDSSNDESDNESEADGDDSGEEEEKPKKKVAPAPKKGFKKKPQEYSREVEAHIAAFSSVLKAVAPDWKKTPESKARAKAVSRKMIGKEFLDENGDVVASFKAEVKKLMAAKK